MATMSHSQSASHTNLPLDSLPSEYRFASSPPVADAMRSWERGNTSTVRSHIASEERIPRVARRKPSRDNVMPRSSSRRNKSNVEIHSSSPAQEEHLVPPKRPAISNVDRKLSNEERYLKSTVDERVARALNERKQSNEEREPKHERYGKPPPRLEFSRLFTRRKSSKASLALVTPSSTRSENFEESQTYIPSGPATATNATFRPSRTHSREVAFEAPPTHKLEHEYPKVNVRKPPPGIQHWFDGIAEEYAASLKSSSRGPSIDFTAQDLHKARDTFLSSSTTPEELLALKVKELQAARKALHESTRSRSPPSPDAASRRALRISKTAPGLRPESLHSNTSVTTARKDGGPPAPSPRHLAAKRHECLPDSIQDSVLVLSETDESDLDDPELREQHRWADDGYEASIRHASVADVVTAKGPLTVRQTRVKHSLDKPLPPIRMSTATVIEDESQVRHVDDNYSSRTSLLSDLRPLSFHSHVSQSTLQPSEDWTEAESSSPTNSLGLPDHAMQAYFDNSRYDQDRPGSGPTHKLMAVTAEEAALLAAIRKRRAQMLPPEPSSSEDQPRSGSAHDRSKPFASPDYVHPRSTQKIAVQTKFESDADSPRFSPKTSPESADAGRLSPNEERRESSDTVSRVWEDVQQWRRVNSSKGSREPEKETDSLKHAFQSRFSPASDKSPPRPPVAHFQSIDDYMFRPKPSATDPDASISSGSANRSKSMDRSSSNTDVERDVLAAWNELGGWRRSYMNRA